MNKNNNNKQRPYGNATMKSLIIPLPSNFIDYLLSDGVRLPTGATKVSSFVPPDEENDDCWSSDDDGNDAEHNQPTNQNNNDDSDDDDNDEQQQQQQQYSFPQLNEQITDSIQALGGSILPKLNWSSPKDATWINNGTMKCQTPGDVFVLLKSSDFVMHDILHAFDNVLSQEEEEQEGGGGFGGRNVQYELVLRKWCNLHPSMEFRCFVCHHQLVAISQRNHTQHFPHLNNDYMSIRSDILDFFHDTINGVFASGNVSNYVFDCYVDKNNRVWLLDFNVWGAQTDSLLFDWNDLVQLSSNNHEEEDNDENVNVNDNDDNIETIENKKPEMRIVKTELEIHHNPLASYRAPIDTVDLATDSSGGGGGSGVMNSFEEFMAMCQRPSQMDDDDDDDDNEGDD